MPSHVFVHIDVFALALQLTLKSESHFPFGRIKKGVLFIVTVVFVVGFCSVNTFVHDDKNNRLAKVIVAQKALHSRMKMEKE